MTKIEWVSNPDGTKGKTYNPITGCSHSGTPGCDNCYAKRMANRLRGRFGYPEDEPFRVTFHQNVIYKMEKELQFVKKPQRVFVCSMADIAHEDVKQIEFDYIMDCCEMVNIYRQKELGMEAHTFMFLTKRPKRFLELWESWLNDDPVPDHFWIGVTAENQDAANQRIPELHKIPASKHFVSVEPMLSYVRMELDGIDWVICGGETGQNARSVRKEWVYFLRNQCEKSETTFFFKKWGSAWNDTIQDHDNILDGREWNEFPKDTK